MSPFHNFLLCSDVKVMKIIFSQSPHQFWFKAFNVLSHLFATKVWNICFSCTGCYGFFFVLYINFLNCFLLHIKWRAVAEKNPSVQYYAGVGVNAYVSVHLSFLPETERHSTRAVARSFCPEFEHHVEIPCNLIVQKSSGEASCLGELLQSANITFSVYHQSIKSGKENEWW